MAGNRIPSGGYPLGFPITNADGVGYSMAVTTVDTAGNYVAPGSGGGGGTGGAVTIADGADTAEGATTAAAYTDATGAAAGTLVGLNKGQYTLLAARLPVAGQKTMANSQPVVIASDQSVVPTTATGNVASGATDSGNPVKVGGLVNTTTPTGLTTGQRSDTWYTANGGVVIGMPVGTAVNNVATSAVSYPASPSSTSFRVFATAGWNYNGTGFDMVRKSSLYSRKASSGASGDPTLVRGAAGDVMMFWGQCGGTATFIQLYNKATAPVVGTDTPTLTYPVAANGIFSIAIPNGGAYFANGVGHAFTTDAAGTTGAAAAAVTAFALLVA